jgi:hypothetical protein
MFGRHFWGKALVGLLVIVLLERRPSNPEAAAIRLPQLVAAARQELKHTGYAVQARSSGLKRPPQPRSGGFQVVAGWLQPPVGVRNGDCAASSIRLAITCPVF